MSTYFPSGAGLAQNRKWYVVDAAGKTVGHLASEIAAILSGKRNPRWTPFLDMGDHVIVVNARKAMFTGSIRILNRTQAGVVEWLMAPGCKPGGLHCPT